MKIQSTLTFIILTALCCNKGTAKNTRERVSISPALNSSSIIPAQQNKNTPASDTLIYPASKDKYQAKLLTTGFFHADEIWPTINKEKWVGIFKNSKGYYIQQTSLKTKRVFDAMLDDENLNQKTGWKISTNIKDSSILLISGLNMLANKPVEQASLRKNEILPGDTLKFRYMGLNYSLYATGIKKKQFSHAQENYFKVKDYKLYLTVVKNGKTFTQLLAAQPGFDDNMINIIFAGDIDGDNLLDLIIDTSSHYSVTSPTLYLSKPAAKGKIIKVMGMRMSAGC